MSETNDGKRGEVMTDWRRWKGLRGHITYWKGWAAYRAYMLLPDGFATGRLGLWLLPSAGDYGYWDDAMAAMREEGGTDG